MDPEIVYLSDINHGDEDYDIEYYEYLEVIDDIDEDFDN